MHPRAQELFEELCELSAEERDLRLKEIAETDVVLADEVRSLLASYENAGDFLADATQQFDADAVDAEAAQFVTIAEKPGDTIGRYKLLEQIGEGGFGQVFMAQQAEPVRRRVALKIIKLGMDTGQALARFEAERQALAMMDHPNIAKVFDGGSTDSGRPFFVMELVRGEPITEYSDRTRMPLKDRLALFRQVCNAIEHAHQKGIVHRDIKPSNVLVTVADDKPLVKVIDFGIAKALNTELTERTLYTEFRQLIGTPQYMSPEQAERSGVDIDTRSDIYSLGVLLYEILTGSTPVDPKRLESAAWDQWQKMIAQEEATRPSAHVATTLDTIEDVATHRAIAPKDLATELKGDLDWIVLKSLEKDRSRRYSTASQFAEDIDRYLSHRPVLASPPDKWYLFSRFLRRNRRSVMFGGVLLVALLLGLIGTATTAAWAMRERTAAVEARGQAEEATVKVGQLAALAVSPLLNKQQADALAVDWSGQIESMRQNTPTDDPTLVRMECQYVTWLATHCQRHADPAGLQECALLTRDLVPRATSILNNDDVNLLSVLNTAIQLHIAMKGPPEPLAELYDKLMPIMVNIYGAEESRSMLPEYAMQLARAKRHKDVERTIDDYLRQVEGKKLNDMEAVRLSRAVDAMAGWGVSHKGPYEKLRAFRDAGRVLRQSIKSSDAGLLADQNNLDGTWTAKRRNLDNEMVINGDTIDVAVKGPKGNVVERFSARFVLSRNGACRLLTRYPEGAEPANGDAVIYNLDGDKLHVAMGMLTGTLNGSSPDLTTWTRKAAADSAAE